MSTQRWFSTALRIIGGALAAVIVLEIGLRRFASPGVSPRPDAIADSFEAETFERRQIEEGVATSHFSRFGARLTGNQPLRSMSPALILGDSYVEADQVRDHHTMGAWVERLARAEGVPLDVRQYGWLGASPAQYLLIAPDLRKRWMPSHVFVVLSANDFDDNALVLAQPRLRVSEAGEVRVVGDPIPFLSAKPPQSSALLTLLRHRWETVDRRRTLKLTARRGTAPSGKVVQAVAVESPPDSLEYARAPEAIVRALHEAYGSSLTLVYLAQIRLNGDDTDPAIEIAFGAACARVGARCVSTRQEMLATHRKGYVGHGAGIAPIGNGHLNAVGHEVVGRIMWQTAAPSIASSTRAGR